MMPKSRTRLMAVLNVTPDSLFGSLLKDEQTPDLEKSIVDMLEGGADIIDVGGESTGPGSHDISADEEWARIEPALKILLSLKKRRSFEISVDTYKSAVFKQALDYGVDILNDVTALRGDTAMAELVASQRVKVCLLYAVVPLDAGGNKTRTNNEPVGYDDVIKTIGDFWQDRIAYANQAGIAEDRLILDPGLGAFVSGEPKYSFEILERLSELKQRFPKFRLLVGPSRKGFTGIVAGEAGRLPVGERLEPSLAAAVVAAYKGADIIRTHDVAATRKVLDFTSNFSSYN